MLTLAMFYPATISSQTQEQPNLTFGADGTDEEGNNYYAKYLEVGYSASIGELGIKPFTGMALDNPDITSYISLLISSQAS